jgi:hypothetical protein
MSNERYSYIEYVCDGSTTTFQIPFNYIEQDDITVYVNGVEESYTFTTGNTIELASAPANGIIVRVSRLTDADIRSVDFRDGSILTEADLDTSAQQIFNVAQEAMDIARDAITVTPDGLVNAQGRQIKGLADPSAPDHAVNLDFIQTEYPNVTAVKANQNNINVVSGNTSNINVVSANTAKISTVAGSIANVNVVAGHVPTLNANYTNITTVANNIADVATLSSQIDGVLQVAASFATQETQPTTQSIGDRWFQPSTATLYIKGNDGNYYEAAIYQSVRHYQWKTIGAAKTSLTGVDSNGNTLYIPPKGHTVVSVDGFVLSLSEDYTITGTSTINLLQSVAAGSTIEARVFTPVLTDEYTWFETNKNTTLGYMNTANSHKNAAELARSGAESAQTAAALSQSGALASQGLASTYKNDASASKTSAASSATAASGSATAAANSATAAANSAASAARNDMDLGSVTAAGLPFLGDTNTGFYRPAADQVGVTTGGVSPVIFKNTGAEFSKRIKYPNKGETPNNPARGPSEVLAQYPDAPSGWYWTLFTTSDRPILMYYDMSGSTTVNYNQAGSSSKGWARFDREWVRTNYEDLIESGKILHNLWNHDGDGTFTNAQTSATYDARIRAFRISIPDGMTFTGFRPTYFQVANVGDPDADGSADGGTIPTNAQVIAAGNATATDLGTNIASLGIYAGNGSGVGVRPRNTAITGTGTATWTNTNMIQTESGLSGDRMIMFYSDGATENFNLENYRLWCKF